MTVRSSERTATTNEAALRFRLRADRVAELADHAALRRFAAAQPAAFRAAILGFAEISRHASLTLRYADGTRRVLAAAPSADDAALRLPAALAAAIAAPWPPAELVPALATVLLDADLRPDDRLLVAGLAWRPWLAALTQGIPVILALDASPATLMGIATAEAATAIAAPASWLAAAPPSDARAIRVDPTP